MYTIKDVSKATGYGIATVSKALNGKANIKEETKILIREKAKEMGYVPNINGKRLASKQSHVIGVIFEERSDFGTNHPFFGEILSIMKAKLEKEHYDILLIGKKKDEFIDTYIGHCIQNSVDGIVVMSEVMDKYQMSKILESQIPTILFDFYHESKNTVCSENENSMYNLVKEVANLNHKKIVYLYGSLKGYIGGNRMQGFNRAVKDFNLINKEEWKIHSFKYAFQPAYYSIANLLQEFKNDLPTAIICTSDILAMAAICAICDAGYKVPDDISVTGYDNIKLSRYYNPAITTVSQDYIGLADAIVASLLRQIKDPNSPIEHIVIDTKIKFRNTLKYNNSNL